VRGSKNNARGFTAVELVIVTIVIAVLVGVTMMTVLDKRRQAMLRQEGLLNLAGLHSFLQMLAWEKDSGADKSWPALSARPGHLAPEPAGLIMQALEALDNPTVFISPAHPNAERMQREARANLASSVTDASYWYLGGTHLYEATGYSFLEYYKETVAKTGKPPTRDDIALNFSWMSIERRRGGSLTFLLPGVSAQKSFYPVMIERPGLQRGGSHVLYTNGYVEFIPYPGKWPMTEKFIKALESLDALKVKK